MSKLSWCLKCSESCMATPTDTSCTSTTLDDTSASLPQKVWSCVTFSFDHFVWTILCAPFCAHNCVSNILCLSFCIYYFVCIILYLLFCVYQFVSTILCVSFCIYYFVSIILCLLFYVYHFVCTRWPCWTPAWQHLQTLPAP